MTRHTSPHIQDSKLLQLNLDFCTDERQRSLRQLRPGDRLTLLRRNRLLPMALNSPREPLASSRAFQRNRVDQSAAELIEAFSSAGISVLVLKGAALAHSVYKEPAMRPRTDTDLLVANADLDAAIQLLSARGYQTDATSAHDVISRQMSFVPAEPEAGVIDLHFALSNQPEFAASFDFAWLAANAVAVPRLSPDARGLHPSHALLHAVMHYYAHLPAHERPAIWLLDIALLARSLSCEDWIRVDGEARRAGICGLLEAGIDATREWFDCPCPDILQRAWQIHGRAEWRSARIDERMADRHSTRLALLGLPSLSDRVRYLWRRAFPTANWMRARYGISSSTVIAGAYLWRLLHGVRRRMQR